jgi:Mitochondrial ribosomal protein (VAR1)
MGNFTKNLAKFKYNKFNPSVNEWKNSIYSFNKYYLNTYLDEKIVSIILNSYFNLTQFKADKFYSLKRIIVGKPDIKHNINSIILNLYIFNKEKLFYLKRIWMLNKIVKKIVSTSLYKKKTINIMPKSKKRISNSLSTIINIMSKINRMSINKKTIQFGLTKQIIRIKNNIFLFTKNKNLQKVTTKGVNNYEKLYTIYNYYNHEYINSNIIYLYKGIKVNIEKRFYIVYLYQKYLSKLYFNTYKFNMLNICNVSKIISDIYNKKVIINIINVKYLHMDNSVFIDAIVRKLRDRNKRVLKVLRKAITLSKIPTLHPLLLINAKKWVQETLEFNTKNIIYKNIMYKPLKTIQKNIQKNIFYSIKNIHIIGIRLEGKGRLTRRLTASRAIFKLTYIGTMKNIFSSNQGYSSILSKGFEKSNIDYLNLNSYNRNGSFGIKSYHNTY